MSDYFTERLARTPVPAGKVRRKVVVELVIDVDQDWPKEEDYLSYLATGIEGVLTKDENENDTWLTRDVTVYEIHPAFEIKVLVQEYGPAGYWGIGETLGEALENARKPKFYRAFVVHPDTKVRSDGAISYPVEFPPKEVHAVMPHKKT